MQDFKNYKNLNKFLINYFFILVFHYKPKIIDFLDFLQLSTTLNFKSIFTFLKIIYNN